MLLIQKLFGETHFFLSSNFDKRVEMRLFQKLDPLFFPVSLHPFHLRYKLCRSKLFNLQNCIHTVLHYYIQYLRRGKQSKVFQTISSECTRRP